MRGTIANIGAVLLRVNEHIYGIELVQSPVHGDLGGLRVLLLNALVADHPRGLDMDDAGDQPRGGGKPFGDDPNRDDLLLPHLCVRFEIFQLAGIVYNVRRGSGHYGGDSVDLFRQTEKSYDGRKRAGSDASRQGAPDERAGEYQGVLRGSGLCGVRDPIQRNAEGRS